MHTIMWYSTGTVVRALTSTPASLAHSGLPTSGTSGDTNQARRFVIVSSDVRATSNAFSHAPAGRCSSSGRVRIQTSRSPWSDTGLSCQEGERCQIATIVEVELGLGLALEMRLLGLSGLPPRSSRSEACVEILIVSDSDAIRGARSESQLVQYATQRDYA